MEEEEEVEKISWRASTVDQASIALGPCQSRPYIAKDREEHRCQIKQNKH